MSAASSDLRPGDKVLHDTQGTCTVLATQEMTVAGQRLVFIRLRREADGADLLVPAKLISMNTPGLPTITPVTKEEEEYEAESTDDDQERFDPADLPAMIRRLETTRGLVARHDLYASIVDMAYTGRLRREEADICERMARSHLAEYPAMVAEANKTIPGQIRVVRSFMQLATLLSERKDFDGAIAVCRQALTYGASDGTVGGYSGRISRIEKARKRSM